MEDVLRTLRKVSFSGLWFGTLLQEYYKRILQEFSARVLASILPFYVEPINFILHQRFYVFHKKLSLEICLKFSSEKKIGEVIGIIAAKKRPEKLKLLTSVIKS